ncbi:MAG: hypothetical protein PHR35_17305 [Kiritimatiellae bacterium]|nr:hypothetical protein [Kiritimatiellia bacterium]
MAASESPCIPIPALGIVDPDEGTIEFWIMFGFDPMEPHEGYRDRGPVLAVLGGDPAHPGDGFTIGIATQDMGRRTPSGRDCKARVGYTLGGDEVAHPMFASFGDRTEPHRWYHFAMAWRGRTIWCYVDGREVAQQDLLTQRTLRLWRNARLLLGGWPGCTSRPDALAIDELRISAVARRPDAVTCATPARADAQTTLLIRFEGLRAAKRGIVPEFAATVWATTEFTLPEPFTFGAGRFGSGLFLGAAAGLDRRTDAIGPGECNAR